MAHIVNQPHPPALTINGIHGIVMHDTNDKGNLEVLHPNDDVRFTLVSYPNETAGSRGYTCMLVPGLTHDTVARGRHQHRYNDPQVPRGALSSGGYRQTSRFRMAQQGYLDLLGPSSEDG